MSKVTAALSNELERQKILDALEANAQTALKIDAIIEAMEPEPEPESDSQEPPKPTPEGALYLDGQGWYQKKGQQFPIHSHLATLVPREPQTDIINLPVEVVLHRLGRHGKDWEWKYIDTKATTMTSGSKEQESGNFESLMERMAPKDGETERWGAKIPFNTRVLNDGRRAMKIRLRVRLLPSRDVIGVTIGYNITTANGNPKKDSKKSRTDPERLYTYGYWESAGKKALYASPRLFGSYPASEAPDALVYDYGTKSWRLGASSTDRTIRHAIRLDPQAHKVPPNPGESLLASGDMWDNGNAGKNDTVDIDTTGWSNVVHHVVQIVEADGEKNGSVLTGIMRLRY